MLLHHVLTAAVVALVVPSASLSPILGVPSQHPDVISMHNEPSVGDYSYLVVTTTAAPPRAPSSSSPSTPLPDDVVPLDSTKERSQFLVTLMMLESLAEKPGAADSLKNNLAADEEVMQEVLKLYETTQENVGKHFIKIPPKLMKKVRRKMKQLLTERLICGTVNCVA